MGEWRVAQLNPGLLVGEEAAGGAGAGAGAQLFGLGGERMWTCWRRLQQKKTRQRRQRWRRRQTVGKRDVQPRYGWRTNEGQAGPLV